MADPTVKVGVFADASQLKRELDKAQGHVSTFGESAKKSGDILRNALFGGAVLFGAKQVVDAANQVVKVNAETERVLKSTGAAAWVSKDQITGLANSLSNMAGVDDEAIQSGENLLLTFTRVRNEVGDGNDVFNRGAKAALDMSTALGTDLNSSVLQLGKALNDPLSGMTALRRAGVSFTEDQQALIKSLQSSGDLLGAQKIILGEVEKEFGGAAAAAKTPMDELKVSLDNLEESVGGAILPAVDVLAKGVSGLASSFSALPEPIQLGALGFAAVIAVGPKVLEFYRSMSDTVKKLPDMFNRTAVKAYDMADGLAGTAKFAGQLGLAVAGVELFAQALGAAAAASDMFGKGNAERYLNALKAAGQSGTVGVLAEDMGKLRKAIESIETAGSSANKTFNALGAAFADKAGVSEAKKQIDELDKALKQLAGDNPQQAAAQYQQILEGLGLTADEGKKYFDDYNGAVADSALVAGTAAQASTDAATSQEEWTNKVKDHIKALEDQARAAMGLPGSLLSLQEAQLRAADALDAYNKKMDDGSLSARDREQAGVDLLQAYLGEADAAVKAAEQAAQVEGKTLSAAEAARIQKADLERLRDTLAPGSPLRAQLQGYIDQLGNIKTDINTTINIDDYLAKLKLSDLQYQLTALDGRVITATAQINARTSIFNDDGTYNLDNNPTTGGGRAFGGTIRPGVPYTVGERGREMIMASQPARVYNSDETNRMMSGGGDVTFQVTINQQPGESAQDLVEKIRRFAKANGGLSFN